MAKKRRTDQVNIRQVAKSAVTADKQVRYSVEEARKAQREGKPLVNTVDSFVNFSQNLGIGADNALSGASYGFNPITRNRVLLEWMHRGSWLAGIIVDCVGDDMTRSGIDHEGEITPEDTATIEEAATGLDIWGKLNETIKWSRLYGGALGVLLIDGQDMSTPLRIDTIREGQFCGLAVVDRWMVEPSLENLVTEFGPDLGLPKFYRITYQAPALAGRVIHHTRCIRLTGIKLPYWQALIENLWGLSVLERIYDRMIAFDSATTGAAQLVYKAYLRTYKVDGLREVIAAGGDALLGLQNSLEFMRRYQSIEGVTLIDSADDLTADSHSAFGGLSDVLQQFEGQVAGGCQIPVVRLFGQSPAGFSTGDTDLQNYYDNIRQQQEKDLRLGVTKVYRCIAASCGVELPGGWKIQFRNLWETKESEKGDIAGKVFDVVSRAEETAIIDKATALKELKQSSKTTGIFTNITDEMIQDAIDEPPPPPEIVGGGPVESPKELEHLQQINTGAQAKAEDAAFPVAAGIMVVAKSGTTLLGRRADSGEWAFPGGKLEPGETARQAAVREFQEETGVPVPSGRYRGMYENFLCFSIHGEAEFDTSPNEEFTEMGWFPLDALPEPMLRGADYLIKAYGRQ